MDTIFSRKNVFISPGSDARADVIFLPTDRAGTPGLLNTEVLKKLRLPISVIPKNVSHYSIVERKQGILCFVVTIGLDDSATLLQSNLVSALRDERIVKAQSLWIPLMGTGTGRLPFRDSFKIIVDALESTGWLDRTETRIHIAPPPDADLSEILDISPDELIEVTTGASGVDSSILAAPVGPAVQAALEFAGALRSGTREPQRPVSTTLLFFALAESQNAAAPKNLATDYSALLFSGAVHSIAARRDYQNVWESYFSPNFVLPAPLNWSRRFERTSNVQQVLKRAAELSGNRPIEIDHLIHSLLTYLQGRHRTTIEAMGISMKGLLDEFSDALRGQIGKKLVNDVAAETDRLGYDRYATAISDFLTNAETPPPLSISIQAPWGAGKSSLMHQIRNKLDPKEARERYKTIKSILVPGNNRLKLKDVLSFLDRNRAPETAKSEANSELWTVWFNAWKYDTTEQMWAGLVDAIVSQISNRLSPFDRELFLLRLQLARIDDGIVRRKIYDRVVTIWWAKVRAGAIAGSAAIASCFGAGKIAAETSWAPWIVSLFEWSPLAAMLILAWYLVREYFKSSEKTHDEPASFSLAEYLTVPDYHQALGNVHHIHEDLLRVLSLTPIQEATGLPSPIVIFIDDLDRCSPSKVASVVEGVSMFLASDDYRCMFVIGMDPQMIAAALEEAHAKVRLQLPRYERTVPLGWRFMDKFIQLPFTIPPSGSGPLEKYVGWLAGSQSSEPAATADPVKVGGGPDTKEPSAPVADPPGKAPLIAPEDQRKAPTNSPEDTSEAEREFKESRDVGHIIKRAVLDSSGTSNPREIKRLANLARLYLGLRNNRRANEGSWRSPSLDQYARWITITLRWPDMMRWLQWGADEGTWTPAQSSVPLVERRLQFLQEQARTAKTADDWATALKEALKVPTAKESDWACDHKLFEFFQAEANLEAHESLSEAAKRDFW